MSFARLPSHTFTAIMPTLRKRPFATTSESSDQKDAVVVDRKHTIKLLNGSESSQKTVSRFFAKKTNTHSNQKSSSTTISTVQANSKDASSSSSSDSSVASPFLKDIEPELYSGCKPDKLTQFDRTVYALVKRIPKGHVSTYKYVAEWTGSPHACRAVGNALRRNPFAPHVPCHRVISTSGEIGGFAGQVNSDSKQIQRKVQLLTKEGIVLDTQTNKTNIKNAKADSASRNGIYCLQKTPVYRDQIILKKLPAKLLKVTDEDRSDAQLAAPLVE